MVESSMRNAALPSQRCGLYAACELMRLAANMPADLWQPIVGPDLTLVKTVLHEHALLPLPT